MQVKIEGGVRVWRNRTASAKHKPDGLTVLDKVKPVVREQFDEPANREVYRSRQDLTVAALEQAIARQQNAQKNKEQPLLQQETGE